MRKSLVALIAGALIIGGAAIATAQTDDSTTDTPAARRTDGAG